MPLYRIDYQDTGLGAVKNSMGDDFLSTHMTTARKWATKVATAEDRNVVISRISGGGGQIKPALVIRADGGAEKPEGMAGEDCKAGPGKPPCFCRNCRAARRKA